ncbi:MAG: peptidylprolyl isomerase [Bacteriovoracaceae bacterium]|nr:peptidylprolyl isomerase [Bacteriovoracaceae bacterium]
MKIFLIILLSSLNSFAATFVVMETSKGKIELELNDELAPITVQNFLDYMDARHYDGLLFHRTIKNFVIQGGGILPDMTERATRAAIINEATNGLSNLRGTIGMARENAPHTATSQFFINTVDNVRLDYRSPEKYGYAVFGKVVSGMDVVDEIQNAPTHTVGEFEDTPVDPILILSVYRR